MESPLTKLLRQKELINTWCVAHSESQGLTIPLVFRPIRCIEASHDPFRLTGFEPPFHCMYPGVALMMTHLMRTFRSVWNVLTIVMLCLPSAASAALITSFESGGFDWWNAPDVNGAPSSVNTDRSSNGIYSTESSFTVPTGWAGWGVHTLLWKDAAAIGITSSTTQIRLDAYANWSNPNGWGVYGNNINLILNYEGGWQNLSPISGTLTNGQFTTLTYDISPYAAAMTAPGLSYSVIDIAWFLGTWADNGQDNGVQTISIDNINADNLVPEPTSLILLAASALALSGTCRRRGQSRGSSCYNAIE